MLVPGPWVGPVLVPGPWVGPVIVTSSPGLEPKISPNWFPNPVIWFFTVSIVWSVVITGCWPICPARFIIWFNDALLGPVGSPPDSTVEIISPVSGSTCNGIGGRGRSKMLGKPPINSVCSSSVLTAGVCTVSIWVPITFPEEFMP